jgi:hypothetical protein
MGGWTTTEGAALLDPPARLRQTADHKGIQGHPLSLGLCHGAELLEDQLTCGSPEVSTVTRGPTSSGRASARA